MTKFASNTLAALVAIIITASSLTAVTTVPADAHPTSVTTTVLA